MNSASNNPADRPFVVVMHDAAWPNRNPSWAVHSSDADNRRVSPKFAAASKAQRYADQMNADQDPFRRMSVRV